MVFPTKNECKDLLQNFRMTGVYFKTSIEYVIYLYISYEFSLDANRTTAVTHFTQFGRPDFGEKST